MMQRAVDDRRSFARRAFSKPARPREGERAVGEWIASIPFGKNSGRFAKTGGTLILTSDRVIFEPLLAAAKLPSPPHSGIILKPLKAMLRADRTIFELSELGSVEALPERGAPRLRLTCKSGTTLILAVLAKRSVNAFGDQAENRRARENAVQSIQATLEA